MKISLNHINYHRDLYKWSEDPAPSGVDELVRRIGAQLGAVEGVSAYGEQFAGVLVAQVKTCDDHPDADRLHICKVDDAGRAIGLDRDENGYVQVVCGAPNVRAGLKVAWIPPGATVPETYGTQDPFVLSSRELRGVVSNGMLASPRELGLGDSHEGIMELDDDASVGATFAEAYDLDNDAVIDIENKMFTHRPDCFGMIGVAREIAGVQHQAFRSPDWYSADVQIDQPESAELPLEIRNEIPELVPRFTAITMRDVKVGPSPVWLQVSLCRLGLRPINNVVDLTNYVMILTGQPLHAYDYDKVKSQDPGAEKATVVVRKPREGEKILLLNGKQVTPRPDAIMIATNEKSIGIGGVMGGGDTEVDDATRNIIVECASFDMYSIRRTSMQHGLFTDAVTRFNKGQSPLQNLAVLAKIVNDLRAVTDAKIAGRPIDINNLPADVMERQSLNAPVEVSAEFINVRLGLRLSGDEIKTLLENVEFRVDVDGDQMSVTAPFWRTDIEIAEDVVEEVGRLYGYDHLTLELPKRPASPAAKDQTLEFKAKVRTNLSRAGANEVLTYSFVHGNLLDKVGQSRDQAYQLSNALSPDLQYYRQSLTPSLLEKIHANIKSGYGEFALFEIGKAHIKGRMDNEVPAEFERVALVFAADAKAARAYQGAAYYQARKYLMNLLSGLGIARRAVFEPLDDDSDPAATCYQSGRVASIKIDGVVIGRIGEYGANVRGSLKLPDFCAGFELELTPIMGLGASDVSYVPLPKFPKVEQDICLKVPVDTTYQTVFDFVWDELAKAQPPHTFPSLGPVDIYQRPDDTDHKQITLRFTIASYERTLTDAEVAGMLDRVAARSADIQAERI